MANASASKKISWWRILLAALLAVVAIMTVPVTMLLISRIPDALAMPERSLPALLVAGVVALLLALAGLVVLFTAAGLEDSKAALGMPEGSIRAVIALMLILLFSIMAIFLYASMRFTSLEVFQAAEGSPAIADALSASEDLARQLLTTVGTLVVAIAAFYFGSNSVTTAASTLTPQGASRIEQLERLAALKDKALLSEEEYNNEKALVLRSGTPRGTSGSV